MTEHPTSSEQDDGPPEVRLVIVAAHNLGDIINHPDRSTADIIRGIDALGRALTRLKAYVRSIAP